MTVPELVGEVARRPGLWPTALSALGRHLPTRWWRPRTALPWLRFRMETAYGSQRRSPTSADLVTWLRWMRDWRHRTPARPGRPLG